MSKKRRGKTGPKVALTKREKVTIDQCVKHFKDNEHLFQTAAEAVVSACTADPQLRPYIHFVKKRVKDASHLREKLRLKAIERKNGEPAPTINKGNLFEMITDLAGVRILHLYTDQIESMNKRIVAILKEQKYNLVEGPIAHIWDDELDRYFSKLGAIVKSR
jgi:ppGpp synthetase/RelA/SpoT-type nucleotidyltranferase